jgi:hypothetical protein
MELLGILALENGELIFLPFKDINKKSVSDINQKTEYPKGTIINIPTPEEVAISKEKAKDYSLEGVLKKNERT